MFTPSANSPACLRQDTIPGRTLLDVLAFHPLLGERPQGSKMDDYSRLLSSENEGKIMCKSSKDAKLQKNSVFCLTREVKILI
jgi:hypothetical protein